MGQSQFSRTYTTAPFVGSSLTPDSGLVLCTDNSILLVDRDGNSQSGREYTGIQLSDIRINDVAAIGDSGYVLVGRGIGVAPGGTPSNEFMIQVLNSAGIPQWGTEEGGSNVQQFVMAKTTYDGQALVAGWWEGLVGCTGWALEVGYSANSISQYQWSAGASGFLHSFLTAVEPTVTNGYLGAGVSASELYVYKADSAGAMVWSRSFEYNNALNFTGIHIAESGSGSSYVAAGPLPTGFALLHLDSLGAVVWAMDYPAPHEPTGVVRLLNGDIWISGRSWLMACDSTGAVKWSRSYNSQINAMERTPEQNGVYLVGESAGSGWLMRTDSIGQVAGCVSTPLSIVGIPTPVQSVGNDGPMDATWSGSIFQMTDQPLTSVVDNVECLVTDIVEKTTEEAFSTFPNPFDHTMHVVFTEPLRNEDQLILVDTYGKVQRRIGGENGAQISIARNNLVAGLYTVILIKAGTTVYSKTVVVE